MSKESKANLIADLLESDKSKWWGWDEILEGIIPGFVNVPGRMQVELISAYMTYISGVLIELDERGYFLLDEGRGQRRSFKIATDSPEDTPYISKRLASMEKRVNSFSGRKEKRIKNLKKDNILPSDEEDDKK